MSKMSKPKFKKSIMGAFEYYESIDDAKCRLKLMDEFENLVKAGKIKYNEINFYKWIRDIKL